MKYIILLSLLFISISCRKKIIEYYGNGNKSREFYLVDNEIDGIYKEYYKNGSLKSVMIFNQGVMVDSALFYKENYLSDIYYHLDNDTMYWKHLYPNGNVESEGLFYNHKKINKWKYYNNKGRLEKVFEYKIIKGQQYTNQGWVFDNQGDTIAHRSNYYTLRPYKNQIKVGDTLFLTFTYHSIKSNPLILLNIGDGINSDFSNLDSVDMDSVYVKSTFTTPISFENKGKNHYRGFICEIKPVIKDGRNAIYRRKVYFDIPINVVE